MRTTRRRRLLAAVTALIAALLLGPAVAVSAAQGTSETVAVRSVDGRNPDAVVVDFFFTGPRETVTDLVLRENGAIVENSAPVRLDTEIDFGIVLAIDTSGSMGESDAFERAINAAVGFVEAKEPRDQVAVVAFNTSASVVQRFTNDSETLVEAIEGLEVGGGTALYDAVLESTNLFAGRDLVANIVLLTDGTDSDSASSLEAATGVLGDSGALLFGIGVETDELDVSALQELASASGGAVRVSAPDDDLGQLYEEIQGSIRRQFRTTFVSVAGQTGSQSLTLTIGTAQTSTAYQTGARLDTSLEVQAIPAPGRPGISALQSGPFLWLGIVLALLAVGGAVFAIGATIVPEESSLDSLLQPYAEGGFVAPDPEKQGFVTSAFLQRAVDLTGELAQRRGLLARAETLLEQANLPLRAGEAIFFYLATVVLSAMLGVALAGGLLMGVLIGLVVALVPPAAVTFLANRRRKQFQQQLPDMLQMLASTLRSGYSMMQGFEAASREAAEPMRNELQRVVTEAQLGMPLEIALDGVVERMESKDFEWAVMAIRIQREVGGNLAELLDTVGETMLERERLRRDVKSLTAEGRVSAIVLGILPLGLGAAMYVINPDYIGGLFEDSFGTALVIGAGLLMVGGFLWMNKLIDVEV